MPCERKHVEALRDALDNKSWVEVYDSLRAMESACDESPWRSMESAPKDGTHILLGAPGRVTCGEWIVPNTMEWDDDPFWGSWDGSFTEENPPTHWMPLPAAPEIITDTTAPDGEGEGGKT